MSDEDDIFGGPPIDMSWADIGRINEEGYVDTQPIGDDPRIFEDQFELRSREKERAPSQLRPVTIVPNRQGPWTANNQLGIEQSFAPDINNRQTILKLDEWGFPEMWTVCLGLDYGSTDDFASTNHFEVTAIIQFGIGGVVQEIEVDWKNGATISLPMNAINVIARYTNPRLGRSPTSIPANLRLRVSLCKGAIGGKMPTRSFALNSNPPDDLVVPIPKFATKLHIAPTRNGLSAFTLYTQPWFVNMRTSLNNPSPVYSGAYYSMSQNVSWLDVTNLLAGGPMWLPVPPFARICSVEVGGVPINTTQATFIFQLAF